MWSDSDGVTFQISVIKLPIRAPSTCTDSHARTGISDDLLPVKPSLRDFHKRTQTGPVLMERHLAGRVSPDSGSWKYEVLTSAAMQRSRRKTQDIYTLPALS